MRSSLFWIIAKRRLVDSFYFPHPIVLYIVEWCNSYRQSNWFSVILCRHVSKTSGRPLVVEECSHAPDVFTSAVLVVIIQLLYSSYLPTSRDKLSVPFLSVLVGLTLEDVTHWLSRNIGSYQLTLFNIPEEWRFQFCIKWENVTHGSYSKICTWFIRMKQINKGRFTGSLAETTCRLWLTDLFTALLLRLLHAGQFSRKGTGPTSLFSD
jgi:hypothetical protein